MPSSGDKGGPGVSPDFDTTQRAFAQKKAMRSGHAERSGEGSSASSPDYGYPSRTHTEEG